MIFMGVIVFSTLFGWIGTLFGGGWFGLWSFVFSTFGCFFGVWAGFKAGKYFYE